MRLAEVAEGDSSISDPSAVLLSVPSQHMLIWFCFVLPWIEPRAVHMLEKLSTTVATPRIPNICFRLKGGEEERWLQENIFK